MLYAFFGSLLAQLPLLLVYIAGLVLALMHRRSFPRATTYLILAIGISLAMLLFSTAFTLLAPYYLMSGERVSAATYGYYAYAVGIISNLGHAAAFGFLLAAIFSGRNMQYKGGAV